MDEKRLDTKWSDIWMPFEYWTARSFEYQQNGRHLVLLCTGPIFKWSVWYIGQSTKTDHLKYELKKVWYSNGRYSDPHCIRSCQLPANVYLVYAVSGKVMLASSSHRISGRETLELTHVLLLLERRIHFILPGVHVRRGWRPTTLLLLLPIVWLSSRSLIPKQEELIWEYKFIKIKLVVVV